MSMTNQSDKVQKDRLVELEEQMLYLMEVPDSIHFLESRLKEISKKVDTIDAVAGCIKRLPIQELLARIDTLKVNVGITGNYERGDSFSGSVTHIEERVNELDSSQKTPLEMINGKQASVEGAIPISKVKILEPKSFYGERDVKALENFIFDLEQYFKATNTVIQEAKVTLATMHLFEDAKLCDSVRAPPTSHSTFGDLSAVSAGGGSTIEGTRIVAQVLPELSRETNVLVETADLTHQIQRTNGEGSIIKTHTSVSSVG
ncbi:uncharacterized protein E6C27_scaffold428G00350 [Cucumis melo var. makuwa]|uniref:Senescence-specific cysteine protease sag39 n=1 Tax=Cucumis melo var. makuwa TaxID=1194695 RepID=A0A5A7UFU8_CUCMM|nr:uncharacterized protein E6C27_scaffold428G00350 [Cucumis melo var. makuwa]